ncbi:unnamed protein product [Adineta ricciae]|uniref:Uncharacterized protein n=1 Tax=Adineta ricciae TaxID=249248 RepID=A0A813SSA8_ADIRI|nr:unnamed protein product [Adineta ricciae]CAF0799959.1 unnamed protein product [Adineta ricciae]
MKMKPNQNINESNKQECKSSANAKLAHQKKTIIFIFVAIIAGISLITTIILVSIEFNRIYRRLRETSASEHQTVNFINVSTYTNSSTLTPTNSMIAVRALEALLANTTTVVTTTTTIFTSALMNITN